MLQPFSDDPEGKRLDPRQGRFLRFAVREDAGQFDDLCQPAAVVLSFDLNLERDQARIVSTSRVYDADASDSSCRICRTRALSGGARRRPLQREVIRPEL